MNSQRLALLGFLGFVSACILGCGAKESCVRGTVTFNGQSVKKGYITFFPIDDATSTRGGEIRDGKYEVTGVPNGKRRVVIRAYPETRVTNGRGKQKLVYVVPSANDISANDAGNNQIIELSGGDESFNFHVRKRST